MATQYNWYKVFNKEEFDDTGLVSRTYNYDFEDIGPVSILVTKGNLFGMTYEGIFLPIEIEDINPFSIDGMACWIDSETDDVYIGFEIPEED